MASTDPVLAEQAVGRARTEPDLVLAEMADLLGSSEDPEARLWARYAIGMAYRTNLDLDLATATLLEAGEAALEAGYEQIGGRALLSYSGALAMAGRLDEAVTAAERAATYLRGADQAAARVQLATFHTNREEHAEALVAYDAAIETMHSMPDGAERLVTAYGNRGLTLVGLGRYAEAYESLLEAYRLIEHEPGQEGRIITHLGWLAALRGDLVAALSWFERLADPAVPGRDQPGSKADYATALTVAGLQREAITVAREAVASARAAGMGVRLGQAYAVLGSALMESGRLTDARRAAQEAADAYEAIGAEPYPAVLLLVRILLELGDDASLARAGELVDEVVDADHRRRLPEVIARLAIGLAEHGFPDEAADRLDQAPPDESLAGRVLLTTARAYVEWSRDSAGTAGALLSEAGALADRYRARLGATDLRASSVVGEEAAALGIRMATADRAADEMLAWAERYRAAAQRHRPVVAARADDVVARYRRLERRRLAGDLLGSEEDDLAKLERRISERARTEQATEVSSVVGLDDLFSRLGGDTFVEFVESDGRWWALVVRSGDARLVELPSVNVGRRLDALDVALGRILRRPGDDRALGRILADLDQSLVAPWADHDRRVVLSPMGPLTAVPWSALPSLADREVTVTPSASVWGRRRREAQRGVAAVAGPGLEHAVREVGSIANLHRDATVLTGAAARVDPVLDVLGRTGTVHVAAHGLLRSDNPLLSAIRLADGPLNVYDIERLAAVPHTVVLSSCSVGASVVTTGSNTIGLATSFLAMGSSTIVASLFEVDDAATVEVMESFHAGLAAGEQATAALARVRSEAKGAASTAAMSFQVYE